MSARIAINGLGRIGRAALKIALEKENDVEVVALNDLTDVPTLAHLIRYDTVYGRYGRTVEAKQDALVVNGKRIPVFAEKDPSKLPWNEHNVDVVLECTGFFATREGSSGHLQAGARRVVISAPPDGDGIPTIMFGVNQHELSNQDIIANGSCTTNCIGPVSKIIASKFGFEKGLMTTIHAMTSTQNLVDGPCKDLRRARAASYNIVPTSTGAAKGIVEVIPSLEGKFDGLSMRVPISTVSLADFAIVTKQDVTVEHVNEAFTHAVKEEECQGIVDVTQEPLVSSDFIGNPYSAIVDLELTRVVEGNLLKIVAWYDNEWGYSNRLVEQAIAVGQTISTQ